MKVEIREGADIKRVAEILAKLRYSTKHWEKVYGADAKNAKKWWEKKADEWIDENVLVTASAKEAQT
jgi:hypothetical protein